MTLSVIKIFLPAIISFLLGMAITPRLTAIFYKQKLWKKLARTDAASNPRISDEYKELHDASTELSTPRVGGIVVWLTVGLTVGIVFLLSALFPSDFLSEFNVFSRNQTLLPLLALVAGGLLGLAEDLLEIFPPKKTEIAHGLTRMLRVYIIAGIGLLFGLWFFFKLDVSMVNVPFVGDVDLGFWFIPFFILVILGTFSSRVIDGLDGLSGGVLVSAFGAYGVIAFIQNQIDIAAFCAVIVGALLVFLWFNIPPARFWMGETGMLGLTLTLALIAFLTHSVLLLPIIGLPLVATSLSSFLQILSKRFRGGKRIFRVAPLHHHFQAIGWPAGKVVMRYWVVSIICAFVGIVLSVVS